MSPKKIIIFDLDGVLLDSNHFFVHSLRHALVNTFDDSLLYSISLEKINGRCLEEIAMSIISEGIYTAKREEFLARFHSYYVKYHHEMVVEDDSIIKLLNALKSKECFLGIATSRDVARISTINDMKISSYFDVIQGTCIGINKKPSPDTIDNIINSVSINCECIFVGDSLEDMEASKRSKFDVRFIGAVWYTDIEFPVGVNTVSSPELLLEAIEE